MANTHNIGIIESLRVRVECTHCGKASEFIANATAKWYLCKECAQYVGPYSPDPKYQLET